LKSSVFDAHLREFERDSRTHFMQVSKWLGHSIFTLTLDICGDYIQSSAAGYSTRCPNRSLPQRSHNRIDAHLLNLPHQRQAGPLQWDIRRWCQSASAN
jgi:hypothetical protein